MAARSDGLKARRAAELASTGVTANAVCPGFTDTDLVAQAVARISDKTGRSTEDAKAAIPDYVKIGFWPQDNAGLAKENLEAIIGAQKRAGNIKGTPTTVERLADTSLYDEAVKLAK